MGSNGNGASAKCPTGVQGLDDILGGGLPNNRFYLVQGDPGVGKTTLAMQFLLEGVRTGERGLYITLSETHEELYEVARSHRWSIDGLAILELSAIADHLSSDAQTTIFHPAEVELNRTTQIMLDEVERVRPQRVVFDSLSELRLLAQSPLRFRRQMLALKQYFSQHQATVLLLDDRINDPTGLQIQSIAHGVLEMERRSPMYGVTRRRINVAKLRGLRYREGFHDFIIDTGGVMVFPRLDAGAHLRAFEREMISSGITELDTMLGGGFHRGTSNVIMGAAGAGKSTIASQYAISAADRGENVVIYIFDENTQTFISRMIGLGMKITEHLESGRIRIRQIDPADHSPGELAQMIRYSIEEDETRMVIIDSLNGYMNSMPEEPFLIVHLHELLTYLSHQGIVSILVMAQHGLLGDIEAPANITFLADTVVYLRFFEADGTVKKAISVIKKRSGDHENSIRELTMRRGLRLGEPLTEFRGVLTGAPISNGSDVKFSHETRHNHA